MHEPGGTDSVPPHPLASSRKAESTVNKLAQPIQQRPAVSINKSHSSEDELRHAGEWQRWASS